MLSAGSGVLGSMSSDAPEDLNLARHLLEVNRSHPESIAFIDDRGEISYGDLANKVRCFASALTQLGLSSGHRVLIVMPDSIEWPIAFLGVMYAGLVPVPLNTLLTPEDYAYLLDHSEAAAAVVSDDLLAKLLRARETSNRTRPERLIVVGGTHALSDASYAHLTFDHMISSGSPTFPGACTTRGDVALWLYSSGSTGRPKGVVHTHENLYWTAELYGKPIMGVKSDDRVFSAAKLFFAYGLGNALTFPLSVGACSILMAERPTPPAIMKRIHDHRATIFCGAPTLYASLLAHGPARGPHSLRLCTSAGEALPREVGQRFSQEFGVDILDGLGSTEMLHIFISNRRSEICYGTTGKPVEGYQVELRDESGAQLEGEEQIGDLWVKGPTAALFYWKEEEKTHATFRDGWVRTGDKYARRQDGSYAYAGRNDDMLKISGQYVSPFEVESTLVDHPSVIESAVVAVPDELGILKSWAFVVLKTGISPGSSMAEELKQFVKGKLAPFKRPHFVEFVADLPKTATGKIQRFKLRERAVHGGKV